jgi:hypothetical protein
MVASGMAGLGTASAGMDLVVAAMVVAAMVVAEAATAKRPRRRVAAGGALRTFVCRFAASSAASVLQQGAAK